MEKEVFLGIYGIRDKSLASSMPAQSESGLWQAWLIPGGGCIIQAVDKEHRPQGNTYLIDELDFHYLLEPVSPEPPAEQAAAPERQDLRPDAPDLLDIWYEQAIIEEGIHGPGVGDGSTGAARSPESRQPDAGISDEEILFSPVCHPDELWDKDRENTVSAYSVMSFPADENPAGEWPLDGNGHTDAEEREGSPFFPHEHGDTVASRPAGDAGLFESESFAYEQSMRRKFRELMEDMTDDPQPALEREMSLLLERGHGFGWKQKYMFSEFGLALRRKHKYSLALAAHMRALGLAPDDEHVLFNVARTEYELGNADNARRYLDKALAISPDFASARTFMQFLEGSGDL